jgi:hypothetical protein
MSRWNRAAVLLAAPLLAAALAGCAIVDDFSGRAVDFNKQAEQAQEQALLLNIVRASLRRPMQFTGLQSITGTASISGGSTLSVPFGEATHRPRGAVSPDVAGFSGTISGGPTFIVPVLDTQEFYEGILAPISLQVFDYYLQQGLPAEVLFDLFVSKIVITQGSGDNCHETTYNNSVNDDVEFEQFQAILDMLLAAGLSTEHVETVSSFGPPIPEASLQPKGHDNDGRQAAALIQAYSNAATAGFKMRKGVGAEANTYRLEKTQVSYRFCFSDPDPDSRKPFGSVDPSLYCNHARDRVSGADEQAGQQNTGGCSLLARSVPNRPARAEPLAEPPEPGKPDSGGNARFNFNLGAAVLRAVDDRLNDAARKSNPGTAGYAQHISATKLIPGALSFKLQVRSTEGILYYLGEVTRRHLYPESTVDEKTRLIQVPTRVPRGAIPRTACEDQGQGKPTRKTDVVYLNGQAATGADAYFCENLFVVDTSPSSSFVSVSYDGASYGLSGDKERTGRTYQVLELVKQILALNTSAKQLPATSVLVISQP